MVSEMLVNLARIGSIGMVVGGLAVGVCSLRDAQRKRTASRENFWLHDLAKINEAMAGPIPDYPHGDLQPIATTGWQKPTAERDDPILRPSAALAPASGPVADPRRRGQSAALKRLRDAGSSHQSRSIASCPTLMAKPSVASAIFG